MADRDTTGTGGPSVTPPNINAPNTSKAGGAGTPNSGSTSTAASTVEGLKQSLGGAADTAMDSGREAVGSAQGRIRSLLEQQTDRAADQLGGVATALHKAADQLNSENNGTVAQYAEQAADRVERVADLLRHSSLDDIVGEVEGFARRQPELFIGGAFALGFLAARFVKSSGERRLQGGHSGTAQSRAAETAGRHARRTSDYRSAETGGRAMAGGIADSALRTPRRAEAGGTDPVGTPKPTIGAPLARAPASVTGNPTAPTPAGTADTALGSATVKPLGQRP